MTPLALADDVLQEILQAAQIVPIKHRATFLERVAAELTGKTIGAGLAHRIAYRVARELAWDGSRAPGLHLPPRRPLLEPGCKEKGAAPRGLEVDFNP
jgi:hypothetical protein